MGRCRLIVTTSCAPLDAFHLSTVSLRSSKIAAAADHRFGARTAATPPTTSKTSASFSCSQSTG
jgi:hypothetical protein